MFQGLWLIGIIFKAIVDDHLPAVVVQRLNFYSLVQTDPGYFVVLNRDKQVLSVQHFVVLEVVQQGVGYAPNFGSQKYSRTLHASWWRHKNCL